MTVNAATITVSGMTLLVAAQAAGTNSIAITSAQISSDVMACTGAEIAMTNVVLTLPAASLSFTSPSSGVLRVGLYLGTTIGDFTIGTVGLFVGSTLFALATFPGAGIKQASNSPTTLGNIRQLLTDVLYQGSNSFSYTPGPIGGAAIAASILSDTTTTVTVRQLKTQLALGLSGIGLAANSNATLKTAMSSLTADNAAVIQYDSFLVTLGDPLAALVASTFGLGSTPMTTLFTAASAQSP